VRVKLCRKCYNLHFRRRNQPKPKFGGSFYSGDGLYRSDDPTNGGHYKKLLLHYLLYITLHYISSTNIRILENCINRTLSRIFGCCDKSSLEYIKICTGLHNIKDFVGKRHCSFIDKLISDVRFSNLLLVYGSNALYRF